MFKKYNHYWHINITITKYLVSCSQKAVRFSNCGEFILRVFSQRICVWVLFFGLY